MYSEPAPYLVEDAEGNLHAYFRKDLLLIDLAQNRRLDIAPQRIFRLTERTLTISYHPIDVSELTAPAREAEPAELGVQTAPLGLAA